VYVVPHEFVCVWRVVRGLCVYRCKLGCGVCCLIVRVPVCVCVCVCVCGVCECVMLPCVLPSVHALCFSMSPYALTLG